MIDSKNIIENTELLQGGSILVVKDKEAAKKIKNEVKNKIKTKYEKCENGSYVIYGLI